MSQKFNVFVHLYLSIVITVLVWFLQNLLIKFLYRYHGHIHSIS